MTKRKVPRPTDGELEILRVLWQNGPRTVRQVHKVLSQSRDVGYTTVLKLLQIMTEKGLVVRDQSQRSHVYEARFSAEQTQQQLLGDLLSKAFGGCMDKLVMQALSIKEVSPEELAEIRKLLDELSER
jgi:predicted transcriptional regulator